MATGSKNAKSQSLTARVPHDVVEGMETVKYEGESTASFITAAMQGEVIRRQLKEGGENKVLSDLKSALEALSRIEEIGIRAGDELKTIVTFAQSELQRRQRKKPKESPES
ncbi:YlcI/YnfO family protein [Serratia quinivorans]